LLVVKFYYDFLSPYSYLASTQLPALAARVGATIHYKPISVLGLMEKVGNQPTTILCEAKLAYAFQDLARWAEELNVTVTPNPHLNSIDVNPLLLGALAADSRGCIKDFTDAVFAAYWTEQASFSAPAELQGILQKSGIAEPDRILQEATGFQAKLEANIDEAVADGVFGTPSFVTDGSLYFGNDRLGFLEKALVQAAR